MQTQTLFLEEYLRSGGGGGGERPSPPSQPASSARAILQSWAELRDHLTSSTPPRQTEHYNHRVLNALQTLVNARASLHVADPQAKLLLSILSSSSSLPSPQSQPLLFQLLYTWLRKSARPSPSLLDSAVSILSLLLSPPTTFPFQGVLLLGALSAVPSLSEPSRRACLDLLCRLLEEERAALGSSEELVPEVLAGIGYALVRSEGVYFSRILASLLGIWAVEGGPRARLPHGLMILSLVEWLVVGFINSRSLDKIESFCSGISAEKLEAGKCAQFAVVMASAGVLRAFRRVPPSNRLELSHHLRDSIEGSVAAVANDVVSRMGSDSNLDDDFENHLLLQCIALGLARCGPFSFHAPVLVCVCFALLNDILPSLLFFRRVLERSSSDTAILDINQVKGHLGSVIFKEAGAVTGIFCNMYSLADEESKTRVESYVWAYNQEFYLKHRMVSLVLRARNDELLRVLEEIAEAVFLMIVVFAAEVTKQKLNPKSAQVDVSVRVLVSFSCIEYLRRIRLPEYTDAVRRAVLTVQENGAACTLFVESMPSYVELTNLKVSYFMEGVKYVWSVDEVQTARILFYLRVIPTCIGHIPGRVFGKIVAPTMFLFMHHPIEKVARASHSVFAAFISSGKDSDEDDQMVFKEKLVFYYMERSLEAYPGITPFEGMASGVAALVRHLPAGSPAIFYCIHSLVGKATDLCNKAMNQDVDFLKNWQGDLEPCKKVLDLLLRLLSLVDIQVLPDLLKLLAQFIVLLPKEGQSKILDDLHSQIAESDDVVRKPTLVSWLQSLSYLSSQAIPAINGGNHEPNGDAVRSTDALSMNGTPSRL